VLFLIADNQDNFCITSQCRDACRSYTSLTNYLISDFGKPCQYARNAIAQGRRYIEANCLCYCQLFYSRMVCVGLHWIRFIVTGNSGDSWIDRSSLFCSWCSVSSFSSISADKRIGPILQCGKKNSSRYYCCSKGIRVMNCEINDSYLCWRLFRCMNA